MLTQELTYLVDSDSQTQQLVQTISSLSRVQGEATANYTASEARLGSLIQRLGQTPDQAIRALELEENQAYQAIQTKLATAKVALLESQALFTDEHPKVQQLLNEIERLTLQQAQYIDQATQQVAGVNPYVGENISALIQELILAESETKALQEQALQLQNQIDTFNNQLGQMPAMQSRLIELQRQYSNAEGVYNGLVAQTQAIQINVFSAYPNVQILDQPALLPDSVGPGKRPIALGALLSSVFGSTALFLFLKQREPLLSTQDIYNLGLPIAGQVPFFEEIDDLAPAELGAQLAFQQLALTITKMPNKHRRFLISSPIEEEGKTTVSLGLAMALSFLGFRVLLIDGDTVNRSLSHLLGAPKPTSKKQAVSAVPISPHLDLLMLNLDENRANQFFVQHEFSAYLDELNSHKQYDYILVDSLPISTHSGTTAMLNTIHSVLLMTWPLKSLKHSLTHSLELLKKNNAEISGLILNGMTGRPELSDFVLNNISEVVEPNKVISFARREKEM